MGPWSRPADEHEGEDPVDGRALFGLRTGLGSDLYRTLDYRKVESTGFVMRADGSRKRELATNMDELDWSPDGTKLAFSRKFNGGFDLCVMDIEDGHVTVLTRMHLSDPVSPTWSPDGTRMAFAGNSDFPGDLYVIDADGSNLLRLTTDGLVSESGLEANRLGPSALPRSLPIRVTLDRLRAFGSRRRERGWPCARRSGTSSRASHSWCLRAAGSRQARPGRPCL